MANFYHDRDVNKNLLKKKKISIIGFGNQGQAHALNLKDSGYEVVVGLRKTSKTRNKTRCEGIEALDIPEAVKWANIIMILVPDEIQGKLYQTQIKPYLSQGQMLLFAHGFAIHYQQIIPPENVDVAMISPKGSGFMLRKEFIAGKGVAALMAVYQNFTGKAREIALAYAAGIGSTRLGVLETTFKEETEADLFGEQVVICGGMTSLMKVGFETLINAGFQPEVAYIECINELKLTVDLIYSGGLSFMRQAISNTAEYGDYQAQGKIITAESKKNIKKILKKIQDGTFARNWIKENETGLKYLKKNRKKEKEHGIEKVEISMRKKIPWGDQQ
jgi:ketol-acid reductoisomerase